MGRYADGLVRRCELGSPRPSPPSTDRFARAHRSGTLTGAVLCYCVVLWYCVIVWCIYLPDLCIHLSLSRHIDTERRSTVLGREQVRFTCNHLSIKPYHIYISPCLRSSDPVVASDAATTAAAIRSVAGRATTFKVACGPPPLWREVYSLPLCAAPCCTR